MANATEKFMTAEYWRQRAEEVRTKAGEMHGPEARATLLQLAYSYAKLAARANLFAEDRERYAAVIAELRHRSRRRTPVDR